MKVPNDPGLSPNNGRLAIFGEQSRSPISVDDVCKLPAADKFVGRVRESVNRARQLLSNAQARLCKAANATRRAEAFRVGQFALFYQRHEAGSQT